RAAGARCPREHGAGDVQVHRLRDVLRAAWRLRRDRRNRRRQGPGDSLHARQADRADVPGPRDLRADRARRRLLPDPRAVLHLRQGDPRAVPDCLHHRQLRGGAAEGAGGDGALRRPQEHRRLRAADRVQLQPRRHDVVSVARQRVRRPARRRADDLRPAAGDDADADADEQRRGGRAARGAGRAHRDADAVRAAARGRGDPARRRSGDGHGAHRGQRHGQLHRHRGRRAVGRRVRRSADAGVRSLGVVQGRVMRIAVVGARGQLAAAVAHECAPAHEIVALAHADLDVTDDAAVAAAMARIRPDVIVNGAAFNDVDAAEDRPVDALNLNAFAVRALSRAAQARGATLVHYSTDFVFDGRASTPYSETDAPSPRSVYAASKLVGEWFALEAPRGYVLRVESLFGRAPGAGPEKGSVAGILKTLAAGGSPKVFADRTISPTYIPDAARATRRLVETNAPPGLYHCVNSG